jgi:hypothetical protein
MKLFAERVAPELRHASVKQFASEYPWANAEQLGRGLQ